MTKKITGESFFLVRITKKEYYLSTMMKNTNQLILWMDKIYLTHIFFNKLNTRNSIVKVFTSIMLKFIDVLVYLNYNGSRHIYVLC